MKVWSIRALARAHTHGFDTKKVVSSFIPDNPLDEED